MYYHFITVSSCYSYRFDSNEKFTFCFIDSQISCLKWILNQKFADSPAIMCGDFNMSPGSPQYIFTTEDILSDAQWNILREKAEIKVKKSGITMVSAPVSATKGPGFEP